MNGPVDNESFRFLRKKSGVKAAELAELLGVRPETVSAWETGRSAVNRAAWMVVAQIALDRLEGGAPMRERLEAIAKGRRPKKRVNLSAA